MKINKKPMKRKLVISILMVIFFMAFNQANAQELNAHGITIKNRMGKITWLVADSATSSVVFFNAFKDMFDKDDEYYEYNLVDPTEVEQLFINIFEVLHKNFFDCYNDPEEEQEIVVGQIDEDQTTKFQVYILSTGFSLEIGDVDFIFIHNTVDDEQALFCNIENYQEGKK